MSHSVLRYTLWILLCHAAEGLVWRADRSNSSTADRSNASTAEPWAWPGLTGRPLAFDIGLYNGRDTMELLRSGHRVVAVEANPTMYEKAVKRFAKFVDAGVLRLVHGALADDNTVQPGATLSFYVHKVHTDWSSLEKSVGCRKSQAEMDTIDMSQCDEVKVNVLTCGQLLQDFGVPYYMKLDIEGHEMACLKGLQWLGSGSSGRLGLPQFISLEKNAGSAAFLPSMSSLGYGRVKMVDQQRFGDWSGPYGELAQDISSGLAWNDMNGYTVPQCTTWCDFHVSLGIVSAAPKQEGELNDAQLDAEVMSLATSVGFQ